MWRTGRNGRKGQQFSVYEPVEVLDGNILLFQITIPGYQLRV